MKANYLWFKTLLELDVSAEKVAEQLTTLGFEVVSQKKVNDIPDGLVVAEVVAKKKHPNADRLNVVDLRYFTEENTETTVEVVCGAANIEQGQKVVFATIGTRLSEEWVIKKAKIRGVVSNGMVCSRSEVGKEEKSEGIWVLPQDCSLDDPLEQFWGPKNVIYDVDVTSNRPDCQSLAGILYDLAAFYQKKPRNIPFQDIFDVNYQKNDKNTDYFDHFLFDCSPDASLSYEEKKSFFRLDEGVVGVSDELKLDVKVDHPKTDCYYVRRINGVQIAPSPLWLQEQLFFHGVRSINNVVDITNWMMLCYGQPMHAFDAKKVAKKMIVRRAQSNEVFVDLRETEISCNAEDVVIADAEKPLALAGIIGGLDSSVVSSTKEIIFEAAVFSAAEVANASFRHHIVTDSSKFFERFVCAKRTAFVIDQATQLLLDFDAVEKDVCIGALCGKKIQNNLVVGDIKKVAFRWSQQKKILGLSLSNEEIKDIFRGLHCEIISFDDEKMVISPPFFRRDLVYEWDLIEEIARIYGYDRIEKKQIPIRHKDRNIFDYPQRQAKRIARALRYDEVITFPIVEQKFLKKSFGEDFDQKNLVEIFNPMHVDYRYLRQDMLYGMLKTIRVNFDRYSLESFRLFEHGHVFFRNAENYEESEHIGFLLAQKFDAKSRDELGDSEQNATHYNNHRFFDLKGDMMAFAESLGVSTEHFSYLAQKYYYSHAYASAAIVEGSDPMDQIGQISLVNDDFLDFFDLSDWRIFYGEFNLDAPALKNKKNIHFAKISLFPCVVRDLAIVVDRDTPLGDMLPAIKKVTPFIQEVSLVEIYSGHGIKKGKKSFVFRIQLRSQKETLSNEQADKIILQVVKNLKKDYHFELR